MSFATWVGSGIDLALLQEQQQAAMDSSGDIRVDLSALEWDEFDGLARRMAASSKIGAAAADVAAPLLLSSDLRVRSRHCL